METFAGGCTRQIARTEKKVMSGVIEIRPFNETRRAGFCTGDILFISHSLMLQINEVGPTTIRVLGEQRASVGGRSHNSPAQLERVVAVQ